MKKNSAFSLIELSIVILIIGILVAGVTQSSRLVAEMRLVTAQQLTQSSPVTSINNLALWLEATSDNSFATGTAGTYTNVPKPDNNDAIGRWNDGNPKVITKINALQATGANQPNYITNSINGLPALRFTNAASTNLSAALDINYTVNPNMTFFIVFKRIGSAADQCIIGHDNGSWDRFICAKHSAIAGSGGVSNGAAFSTVANINSANITLISLILQNSVSSGSNAYLNGGTATSFTESHGNSGYTSLGIGSIAAAAVGASFDGDIGEIIIFDRALKTEERQSIEKYLGQKWGIKIS